MKIDTDNARRFIVALGSEIYPGSMPINVIRSACPLAKWKHKGGKDRSYSFSIKISDKRAPRFRCSKCGAYGTLPKLLHMMNWLESDPHTEASMILSKFPAFEDGAGEAFATAGRRILVTSQKPPASIAQGRAKEQEVHEDVLASYPLLDERCEFSACDEVIAWLAGACGVNTQSIADFQLRLYQDNEGSGVVFPVIDPSSFRVSDLWVQRIERHPSAEFRLSQKSQHQAFAQAAPRLWFGNHLCAPGRPLILVEGALDALRLRTLFPNINVLASLGPPSDEQLDSIHARLVLLGFGANDVGRGYALRAGRRCQTDKLAWLNWGVVGVKYPRELSGPEQFKKVYDARKTWVQANSETG
ncbi:toprim domain-containing protein [Fundidesulfovibrio soli]|uniref:toprim domain-containing protein n=1 Tax=Fundidesulfovibrio soli TaxID=2922716 RepID=UPI001FAF8ED5|nr:toprim domain-containing protein [Fundidesulfovibrio soli]